MKKTVVVWYGLVNVVVSVVTYEVHLIYGITWEQASDIHSHIEWRSNKVKILWTGSNHTFKNMARKLISQSDSLQYFALWMVDIYLYAKMPLSGGRHLTKSRDTLENDYYASH